MHLILTPLRATIRALRTTSPSPPLPVRLLLAAMLTMAMGMLVVAVRVYAMLRGPLRVTAETASGTRMVCRLPDLIQMYIWLFDIWEPDLTRYIQRRLEPGDGFIDVGANVGYFSLLAGGLVGPTGTVAAIEASPRVFAALEENLALNRSLTNIVPVNRAASDLAQSIQMYSGPAHNLGLSSTVDHQQRALQAEAVVEAAPLGDLMDELDGMDLGSVQLIKIDVEGGEVAVLSGLIDMIARCSEEVELLVELSPNWWTDKHLTPREVLQPLFDLGFQPYVLDNNYWPWRYLWSHSVSPPRRLAITDDVLDTRVDRIDLVLSRRDGPAL